LDRMIILFFFLIKSFDAFPRLLILTIKSTMRQWRTAHQATT
jgi:hypothetical protein